jgi:hypothetical protein
MQPLKRGIEKDWIRGVFLVIAWMLIFSLAKDFWQVKKGFTRIEEAKERLAVEEKRNEVLKDKLRLVSTEEYKEQVIREQLNMQKIGEVVAVLPKNELLGTTRERVEEKIMENWEKWWSLLK